MPSLQQSRDPFNPGYEYGTAGFDRRQIAVVNFDYNLPIFQNSHGVAQTLVGGWTVSGVAPCSPEIR